MTRKTKLFAFGLITLFIITLFGCREANRVNWNTDIEADNFNTTRRLEVINARTDKPLFELIGNFSLSNNDTNELVVTVELENGTYKNISFI